jgi:hypothetical protein
MSAMRSGATTSQRPAGRGRERPFALAAALVAAAGALAVAWYLASPLVIRSRLDEGAPARGVAVARGTFSDRDAVHRGSGVATLERDQRGVTLLRLSDFRVTNGPDLYVYLTAGAAPDTPEDVTRGGVQVGRLKASEGGFTYELPPGTDPEAYRAAVIYCLRFRTIFSVAPLARA